MATHQKRDARRSWPSTQISLLENVRAALDPRAWPTFIAIYEPLLRRYCQKRGLQDADTRDVVQNVFCRLEKALPAFQYDRRQGRFRGWLGTITYREIRHYRRKADVAIRGTGGEGTGLDLDAESTRLDPEWTDAFNSHMLQTALARIRPEFDQETWDVFEQVWLRGVDPITAGAVVGKKPAWVYKAKFRVSQRLRVELEFLAEDAAVLQR